MVGLVAFASANSPAEDKQRFGGILSQGVASSDAHESSPYRRKAGADQNVEWIVTESASVSTHLNAEGADLMVAGCVEQPRQDGQNRSYEIHQAPLQLYMGCDKKARSGTFHGLRGAHPDRASDSYIR